LVESDRGFYVSTIGFPGIVRRDDLLCTVVSSQENQALADHIPDFGDVGGTFQDELEYSENQPFRPPRQVEVVRAGQVFAHLVRLARLRYHKCMKRPRGQEKMQPKRIGRPPTGIGAPVQVRLQPDLMKQLDAWRGRDPDLPSRPEAIRRLLQLGLRFRWKSEDARNER
jgi:hypothetical protein